MAIIAYTGLENTSLSFLQNRLRTEGYDFHAVEENNLSENLSRIHPQTDLLLIGERADNPIKSAQAAYALDKNLSTLLINETSNFTRIKQALLFTPFVGNSVQCLSNDDFEELIHTVEDALIRTRQRRNYAKLKELPITGPFQLYENIRSEYLDKFLEEAPIGALLLNQDGQILAINRHATHVLGITEKEMLGSKLSQLFTPKQAEELQEYIRQDIPDSSPHQFERIKNGQAQHLELRLAPLNADILNQHKIGILSDISEKIINQNRIEEQLEDLSAANNSLRRANSDLDTFVYTASHDLKAPIINIEGLTKLLKTKIENTRETEAIFQMIEGSILRFQETIRDLTDVAFIQKNSEAETERIDIAEVVEDIKSLIHEMIVSSNAHIELDVKDYPTIQFSKSNFRSIVYNLISNAIKYRSPERSPHIYIKTEKVEGGCSLSIRDNGIGFDPERKDKIFSMFKRLHSHVEGTGIGLFIVKRIVDNNGGEIEVYTELDKGTTFWIYLKAE